MCVLGGGEGGSVKGEAGVGGVCGGGGRGVAVWGGGRGGSRAGEVGVGGEVGGKELRVGGGGSGGGGSGGWGKWRGGTRRMQKISNRYLSTPPPPPQT